MNQHDIGNDLGPQITHRIKASRPRSRADKGLCIEILSRPRLRSLHRMHVLWAQRNMDSSAYSTIHGGSSSVSFSTSS